MDALEAGNKQVKDAPPLPIKTYQWEDIRRARQRGGYPWTYLDKRPFDDNCFEDLIPYYPKDNLRKAQSSFEMASSKDPSKDAEEKAATKSSTSACFSVREYLDKSDTPGPSQRAKSEEPRRKRKHSMVSNSSWVSKYSLSRLGFLKKLKAATSKLKLPKLGFAKSGTKINTTTSDTEKQMPKKASKRQTLRPTKPEGPMYIHIPLKPPPGERDEFSYLEFEEKTEPSTDTGRITKEDVPTTPSENGTGVQLIILTAPSDDEILHTAPVLETPMGADNPFFESKEELKTLARDVVDKYSPETQRKVAETTMEETNLPREETIAETLEKGAKKKKKLKSKSKTKEEDGDIIEQQKMIKNQIESDNEMKTQVVIDDEDGLKTETIQSQIHNDDVKKVDEEIIEATLRHVEESPILKKKVSFKRKSKEDSTEIYEEVQVTSEPVKKEAEEGVAPSPTPNLLIDEKETKFHKDRVKGMTIAEEYEYWCQVKMEPSHPTSINPRYQKRAPVNDVHGRSMSEGTARSGRRVNVTRDESSGSSAMSLDVRCACQFFQCQSLMPEKTARLVLTSSRPTSRASQKIPVNPSLCHNRSNDYEPINPPEEELTSSTAVRPKKPGTPVTDSDIEFLASKVTDIELRTTGIIKITSTEDKSESVFVPLESVLKLESPAEKEVKDEGAGHKIQEAICKQATNLKRQASIISKKAGDQAEKLQTRVKSIKRPKIKLPSKAPTLPKIKIHRPSLAKLKIERPRMPNVKIPERMKNISLSLPRRNRQRPTSTDSTAGESDKRNVFDFSTYPRIFRRKKREDDGDDLHTPRTGTDITPDSERVTLPRFKFTTRWKGKFTSKPESSRTTENVNDAQDIPSVDYPEEVIERDEREDSVERRMRMTSNDMDDAYMKENEEIHRASSLNAKQNSDRWMHGTFHTQDMEENGGEEKPVSIVKKRIESGSCEDIHQRGVLEEISSDEFFLRQKGISQDNIEVGAYLSSEIREAFRTPNNALSQLETLPPEAPKRRAVKKPKRKKTPHVSQEDMGYDRISNHTEPEPYPEYLVDEPETDLNRQPARPRRRNRKNTELLYGNQQIEESHFLDKSVHSLNAMSEHDSITGEINGFKEIEQMNQNEHEYQIPTPDLPKRPSRTHSRTRSRSRGDAATKGALSASQTSLNCREEQGTRFNTVPRCNLDELPSRPLRNYSTLSPNRPPRKQSLPNMTDEEKNVSQYIEIDDDEDHIKNLHSGDVIQKMKDRPLPAPPRPPRRARDIISTNRKRSLDGCNEFETHDLTELEVAIQTESLPVEDKLEEDKYAKVRKPRNVQEFEHQETITHGSLIVQPFAYDERMAQGPIETYSKSTERIVTVKREANSDKGIEDDEISAIPEEFKKLQLSLEKRIPIQLESHVEVETLKAVKLQVSDMDVERLAVNELHASKITVGDIEGASIVANEISSNSGNLVVSGIELPASFFQQLAEKLQGQAEYPAPTTTLDASPHRPPRKVVETKETETNTFSPPTQTFIFEPMLNQSGHPADVTTFIYDSEEILRKQLADDIDDVILSAQNVVLQMENVDELEHGKKKTSPEAREGSESAPTPPPRPPHPDSEYYASLPPSSFYTLRSPAQFKDYEIDNDIPSSSRRRRHHHHHRMVESSSEDTAPTKRRYRTPEPSIAHLSSQLTRACLNASERAIRRVIQQIIDYIFGHVHDKHDLNVAMVILIVFIAVLFLIGWNGDNKQIHHHWEYFNPPRDI